MPSAFRLPPKQTASFVFVPKIGMNVSAKNQSVKLEIFFTVNK
jgi:uncharacterized protein (DUF3084 family)